MAICALKKTSQVCHRRKTDDTKSAVFRYPESAIVSLPELPPEPEPLDEWYQSSEVETSLQSFVQTHLKQAWEDRSTAN